VGSPEAEQIARLLLRSITAYLMPFDRSLNPIPASRPKRIVRSTPHHVGHFDETVCCINRLNRERS